MNQLELLNDVRLQVARDSIVNSKAIYLGAIYVYYNKMYISIHSFDRDDGMVFYAIEPIGSIINKEYILNALKNSSAIPASIDTVGYEHLYIDGLSDLSQEILNLYDIQKSEFDKMNSEYEEFVDYVNYHLNEILLKGEV